MRGRARRDAARPAVLLAALALAGALLFVGIPALTRGIRGFVAERPAPSTALVSVVPTDAVITMGRLPKAVGRLKTGTLEPGTYGLRITRRGFETLETTLAVKPREGTVAEYTLRPLPQALTVTAHPSNTKVSVAGASGAALSASGTLRASLLSGRTLLTLSAPGYSTLTRELFLDGSASLELWLDPVGQVARSLGVFKCVPAPKGVAVTPDGRQFWVTALVTKPSIAAYDITGRMVGQVTLGSSGAVEVIFNRDGTKAYASQMQSASVFEIDAKSFRVLRQLKTGSSWTKVIALSPDETRLYAANWSGDDVSEIDLATGKLVRRIPTVDTPRGLWPTADGTRLFVAGFGEQTFVGRLAVIDLATGKSRTFFSGGKAMRHMVADEKRGLLFTSDMGAACVWVTDMRTLKTKRFLKTDSHPNTIDLTPDGKVLVVSNRGANNPKSYYIPGPEWGSILLFDAVTGKPLDAIVGGNQCTALDLSPDGRTLVFSDFLDNRLRVYSIPPYPTLAAGKGGRYAAHFADIRKPGWGSVGRSSGGGD